MASLQPSAMSGALNLEPNVLIADGSALARQEVRDVYYTS